MIDPNAAAGNPIAAFDAGAAFWRFSLALYARAGVAAALIALQDQAGRDVNLMLFALWRGAVCGKRLDAAELAAAQAAIEPISAGVVRPLRGLRRQLRGTADPALPALRRQIAALELVGERAVQRRLAECAGAAVAAVAALQQADPDRLAAAMANLSLYLGGEIAAVAELAALRRAVAGLIRHPLD